MNRIARGLNVTVLLLGLMALLDSLVPLRGETGLWAGRDRAALVSADTLRAVADTPNDLPQALLPAATETPPQPRAPRRAAPAPTPGATEAPRVWPEPRAPPSVS